MRKVWHTVTVRSAVILVGLATLVTLAPARLHAAEFTVPPGLKKKVEFWKLIFGTYSTRQVVIHDTWHLDRIYAVLDFRPLEGTLGEAALDAHMQETMRAELERIRAMLLRFHQMGPDPTGLTAEERKIWAMFAGSRSPARFQEAAADDRLRTQRGLRERFAHGVEISRQYLPQMEATFRRHGLPIELTRLPLVESCFNVRAYSKVGAAGMWQFMPATGRQYMRVDNAVDERRDPFVSTEAAAKHLKSDYRALGSWPLAITAYNHGRGGVARAVRELGTTDIVRIVHDYRGRAFKFASRNFYAEFLAALEVDRDMRRALDDRPRFAPVRAEHVLVPGATSLKGLAHAARTDPQTLAELNPALTPDVVNGRLHVPRGYRLRVPAGGAAGFATRYASLAPAHKPAAQRARIVKHRVQKGQTLTAIAKRYGTTVAAIQRHNRLRDASQVKAGQQLVIPAG